MYSYYYIDVSLDCPAYRNEISAVYFKQNIIAAVDQLFGELTSCVNIDILKYSPNTRRAILRVPLKQYVKIRSSLTLCPSFKGNLCEYVIHKTSPLLIALAADSRNYLH